MVGERSVGGKQTYTDQNGDSVTLALTGLGGVELWFPHPGQADLQKAVVTGTTEKSALAWTIKKGTQPQSNGLTTVGEIEVTGPLASLTGALVTLTGNLTVMGTLGKLTLDDVGTSGGSGTLTIGGAATPRGGVVLIFDRVTDTGIFCGMPIASITAAEWLNTGLAETLQAPRLGTLAIKGDKTHAGDFAANLMLQGLGLTGTAKTLASATIKGSAPGTTWDLTGPVGTVTISGTVGEAGTPWQLTGPSMVDTLTLGDVTNANVTVSGALGAVKALRWLAGSVQATKATSIASTGLAKPPVIGDFGANVTLSGVSVTGTAKTLGSASIKGNVGASLWDLTGPVGTLAITGTVGTVAQPWQLTHPTVLGGLTLGDVTNATVNVSGESGAIKAKRWQAGSIWAAKIASISATGVMGTKTVPALSGDFGADVTVTGTAKTTLAMSIAGWLDGAMIFSTAGPVGRIAVGGLRNTDIQAGDAVTHLLLGGLTVNGIKGQTYSFINSNVSAWTMGTISLKSVKTLNTDGTPPTFGVTGHKITSYSRDGRRFTGTVGPKVVEDVDDFVVELV